ncbi:tetratricopeptide repeat protein [Streptomyces collinus]|uniref:tetratricopeptide repeat protein n=1 Tax=Streptomyces collinus TaxID=42684 RepID=UPI0036BC5AE7
MTERLMLEVAEGGRVTVQWWPEGEPIPSWVGEPVELEQPLDGAVLRELRWYLEEYLRAPFGVYGERGLQAAAELPRWGEQVFSAVFGAGPARDAYLRAWARAESRNSDVELVVVSGAAQALGWPWELMRDPGRPTPLALDTRVAVSRTMPTGNLGEVSTVGGSRLRVLMVISRPRGTRDVGYQMIARPLLERLAALRGQVELVVLRPPTLDRLQEVLTQAREAGEPFQIVHFDGHGLFGRPPRSRVGTGQPVVARDPGPQGMLAFEKPEGGADLVPAEEVARVLKQAQVPVVVLNACQSAVVGSQVEAAVATRLLQEGTAAVVAMAYSVYAVAAAEFMAAFYERLFAGDRVSEAVAAGRRRLAQQDLRPSPKGMMPLADWVVPVLYTRSEVRFPGLRTERPAGRSLEEMLDRIRERPPSDEADSEQSLEATGEFIGRDALLYTLDVAARLQRVVVLHGPGGTGKTELAKAFGRWWRDTGALDHSDGVIWHSFEPGVASFGLDGVITSIGLRLFGARFALLDPEERQAAVEELLRKHRLVLVWDNFESVHTMPDPTRATPPLPETGRNQLRDFLSRIAAHGTSAVVITSRTREDWLGPQSRRVEVPGLDVEEAGQYADHLLVPYRDAQPRREVKAFGELMQWLDGHPLSMRIILPHLGTTSPRELLVGLQGTSALPDADTGDRTTSLAASITYSFTHLPTTDQHALTVLSLLNGTADADVLAHFSAEPETPEPFRGRTNADWTSMLKRAAEVGLLTPLGVGMYRIHPALPNYLTAHWRTQAPGTYRDQYTAATRALLEVHADLGAWLTQQIDGGKARLAMALISHQQHALGSMLGYALEHGLWTQAQAIVQPLDEYWDALGLMDEARAWFDRARQILEAVNSTPPALDTPAGALWLFVAGAQAKRQLRVGQLGEVERTYHDILEAQQQQPATPQQRSHLAVTYHQLGLVAQDQGRLQEAVAWYGQSLSIKKDLNNRLGLAGTYHQLGIVARARGRLQEAENWHRQALTINEDLNNRPLLAATCHHLGIIAQDQGRLEEAEDWHRQSLTIHIDLYNQAGLAVTYHEIGNVAQARGRLEEAEDWYRQALTINEDLNNRAGLAVTYRQLGIVAQLQGRLEEAEDWYRQSLTIHEDLNDLAGMAMAYQQLGIVAQDLGRLEEAEDQYRQALTINQDLDMRPGMASAYHQLGRVAELRRRLEEAEDWYRQSLTIHEDLNNWPGMAMAYHQLGVVAHLRGRLEEAEDRYRQSLTIKKDLNNRLGMASTYHQLGIVARDQGRLQEAEDWYRQALTNHAALDNSRGMTMTYRQLGLLAEVRHQTTEALVWLVRCVALFDQFPHPATGPAPGHLKRLTHTLGIATLERAWQNVTGNRLPSAVRRHVLTDPPTATGPEETRNAAQDPAPDQN